MMTEEEKEAIEWLERLVKINKRDNLFNTFAEILLNMIQKQSKEIEELKEEKAIYYHELKHLEANVINKIQEYDDKGMTVNLLNRSAGKTFQQAVHYEVKKVLQSLLEKE